MGMNAEVLAIGKFHILRDADALEYPLDFYKYVDDNDIVHGTIAVAFTNEQSRILAKLCGTSAWDLGHHKVTKVVGTIDYDVLIGDDELITIINKLKYLLEFPDVLIFYRPNG